VAGLYGADIAQLRSLAKDFQRASQVLQLQGKSLTNLIGSSTAWTGNDASTFREEWNSSHRKTLMAASQLLEKGSKELRANAEDQERASTSGGAGGPDGSGGPGGTGNGEDGNWLQDTFDWSAAGVGMFFKIKDAVGMLNDWQGLLSSKKILDSTGSLLRPAFQLSDDFTGATKLLSKWGRLAGPALAPFAIGGGIMDMINPSHDGWRGTGDRIGGGLSVIAGGGSLLMAAGLLTNPVGIGIVVGAGLVAGGWALGNMIADSEWGQATGRWIGNRASDVWNGTKDLASDAWNGAKDAVSDTWNGAKEVFSNPVKSLGGLFS
jgi:uncharacterized protein YukE